MAINIDKIRQNLSKLKQNDTWTLRGSVKSFLDYESLEYQENTKATECRNVSLYLKEYKVAIDLCSVETHCAGDSLFKSQKQFYDKAMQFKQAGIRLIYIWDWEWFDLRKQKILKNIILNACQKDTHRVYARNTYVKVVPAISIKEFFLQNNMQGYRVAKDAVCLYDKKTDELLMAYSIGYAYFGKGKYDLEIARGACKLGYSIVGGSSKLWKYIVEQYAPDKSIVYYVDLNQYNGNSLDKLVEQFPAMKFITGKQSFRNWFVEEQKMRNRDPKHHAQIKELTDLGLIKVCYNAGSLVYVYQP